MKSKLGMNATPGEALLHHLDFREILSALKGLLTIVVIDSYAKVEKNYSVTIEQYLPS
jgi:hypothetical protein